MAICVIDSMMGSGKSTWAFRYMDSHPEEKFIYVTPFLDECERAQRECPNARLIQPSDKITPSKQLDFKRLALQGKNIATTHELISQLALSDIEYAAILDQHYTMILDETVETVRPYTGLSNIELDVLVRTNKLEINPDGSIVKGSEEIDGSRFKDVMDLVRSGSIFRFEDCILLWILPISILQLAQNLVVMTFLFDASHLKHTLDMNHMAYQICHVKDGRICQGEEDRKGIKNRIKNLIHILEDRSYNSIGQPHNALSATWWKNARSDRKQEVVHCARSFFMNKATGNRMSSADCMWAVYGETEKKDYHTKRKISVKDYDSSCVAFNQKAENKYITRTCLAYLVNIFEHPIVKKWFESNGQVLNDYRFALSTMLQWIWRSAIRNGQEIYLYLPSSRMRKVLEDWLDS